MNHTARLYNCARCHCQVIVCSDCDRGNIYCGSFCAKQSRIKNHRIVNHNYQNTFRGRQKHALRQSHYRLRQKQKAKKVTDQGSVSLSPYDLLPTIENDDDKTPLEKSVCHFCKNTVSPYCRNGYLRYGTQHQSNKFFYYYDTG